MIPTNEQLHDFFTYGKFHANHKETKELYYAMKTHINKEYPGVLIDERRPSESTELQEYRKSIYKSKTANPPQKVLNSLGKIRRSKDWSIVFPKNKDTGIIDQETLEEYCTKNYPGYGSVEQWAFTELIKTHGIDANAYIAVIPQKLTLQSNEYYKPVALTFHSDNVCYPPEKGDYCILKSTDKVDFSDEKGNKFYNEGNVYYLITPEVIRRYEQMNHANQYRIAVEIKNPFPGEMPVFKIRGAVKEQKDNAIIQVSRLDPMLTSLDEAAREYSDLQAVKVQHAHPLFWYYEGEVCPTCNGSKMVLVEQYLDEGIVKSRPCAPKTCITCNGTGTFKFSPYSSIKLKPNEFGKEPAPTPPAGYIQKDVEVMRYLGESVKEHLYDALAAVNFQFLDQTPLSISGKAKEVDREELTNFVYYFAEDLVYSIEKVIYWINEWRYLIQKPNRKARQEQLPKIAVPMVFDMLPPEYLIDAIAKAKTSKVSAPIVAAMEADYVSKVFYNKPEVSNMLSMIDELNPMPGVSDDEKMVRLSNKGITLMDYIISSNIEQFVKRAFREHKDFMQMKYPQQIKIIEGYADEKKKQISAMPVMVPVKTEDAA